MAINQTAQEMWFNNETDRLIQMPFTQREARLAEIKAETEKAAADEKAEKLAARAAKLAREAKLIRGFALWGSGITTAGIMLGLIRGDMPSTMVSIVITLALIWARNLLEEEV